MPDPDLSIRRLYWNAPRTEPRLKVGILLDTPIAEACYREVLVDIRSSNFVELRCVILNAAHQSFRAPERSGLTRHWRTWRERWRWRGLLYRAYLRLVDRRYALRPDPTAMVDCAALLEGVDRVIVHAQSGRFTDRFSAADVERIRGLRLDVIIRFGFNILKGGILSAARCGVWSYHHGDSAAYRGGPPMLWELIEANPESGAVLQVLTEQLDAGPVLCKAVTTTSRTPSVSANRFAPYWLAQHFVIRKLRELHEHGWDAVRAHAEADAPFRGRRRLYTVPDNATMLKWAARVALTKVHGRLFGARRPPQWRLAIRRSTQPLYDDPSPAQLSRFRILPSPAGTFWADPFLIRHAGRLWLFFEDYRYATNIAHISCAEISPAGELGAVQSALARPHHLSYPFVFEHQGSVYMIPESYQAGGVDLYLAESFPTAWTKVCRLFDFPAVDVTPLYRDGMWWMFVSPAIVVGHEHLLMLFKGDTLQGPWQQVAASPLVSDPKGSRGAGVIFESDGRLIRPTQDCSKSYGGGLQFRQVDRLHESRYAERVLHTVEPNWRPGLVGVHTYNRVDDIEVIDVKLEGPPREV